MNRHASGSSAFGLADEIGGLAGVLILQKARQQGAEVTKACETMLSFLMAGKGLRQDLKLHFDTLGLNEIRLGILNVLSAAEEGRFTPAFLAERVKISRSAMTEALDGLEQKGWVRRERCHQDRRQIYVEITEEGRRLSELGVNLFLSLCVRVVSDLGEESSQQLIASCDRLLRSSHAQRHVPDFSPEASKLSHE